MGGSHGSFQNRGIPGTTFKVVVLGNRGCGKSTIIRRYVSNQFVNVPPDVDDDLRPTQLTTCMINLPSHGTVGVTFWELAASAHNLIRTEQCENCSAAIVVVKSSEDDINSKMSLWRQAVRDLVGGTVPILILVNSFQDHPLGSTVECGLAEEVCVVRPAAGEDRTIHKVINQLLQRLTSKPYPVAQHMHVDTP